MTIWLGHATLIYGQNVKNVAVKVFFFYMSLTFKSTGFELSRFTLHNLGGPHPNSEYIKNMTDLHLGGKNSVRSLLSDSNCNIVSSLDLQPVQSTLQVLDLPVCIIT